MGKCRSDRGTVLPSASFVPPGSTKAKSESGRLLMDWVVSCATTGFLSRPAAFSVPVDRYGFHRRRERLQCPLLAGLRGPAPRGDWKSKRLNSRHTKISYAVFCLQKKITYTIKTRVPRTATCTTSPEAVAKTPM